MHQGLIEFVESCKLPTEIGEFKIYAFKENTAHKEHLMITFGDIVPNKAILARIHSQCLTGESLLSLRCDCRFQLTESLKKIKDRGEGVVFYLQQEGRDIGLLNKIKAYKLQDQGMDTVEANNKLGFPDDARDYKIVCAMAKYLSITSVDLMTNNPNKIKSLKENGLKVNKRIPINSKKTKYNKDYLETKAKKLGHFL